MIYLGGRGNIRQRDEKEKKGKSGNNGKEKKAVNLEKKKWQREAPPPLPGPLKNLSNDYIYFPRFK